MTDTTNTEEILELVKEAQAPGKFDITAFAKGRAYPEDSVVAFLDVQAAYDLSKVNEKMQLATSPEELAELEKKAEPLVQRVKDSKVTFYMRGVNQAVVDKVTQECDKNHPQTKDAFGMQTQSHEWLVDWTAGLVAYNLVKIENANGDIDEREFTLEDVHELRLHLPKDVWEILINTMQKLSLATAYFDGMTDAGFLPKS